MAIQLAPNLVIADRFRLNRLIGRGGMGSVWHATHLGLDIPCAVKFIEGEIASHPEAQLRFEREAKAAAQLRSPHVVQILDHGVCQGTPYIAMELLDGEDLGKRLQRVGRLGPLELSTVVTQVCRALTKAHAGGIVHRDLKPDNIFLVRDDDREIAKVLDFGIAKANTTSIEGSNTKTGAMLGTPYYMSPEQAQGTKAVDHRADLWSLAVIVFQSVTGRLPFESEALGDLLVKIIVNPIPLPSHVAPDVPQSFDRWWERASARDPNMRFQSAKEFGESLSLVFGLSSMTDVMDRGQLRAAMASQPMDMGHGGPGAYGRMPTPMVYGSQPPQPNYGGTPRPSGIPSGMPSAPPGPGAGALTPSGAPRMPSTPGVPNTTSFHVNTGAPMARTYDDAHAAGVPKSRAGVAIAAAFGGLALLGMLAAGAFFLTRPRAPEGQTGAASATVATTEAPAKPPTLPATPTPAAEHERRAAAPPPPASASAANASASAAAAIAPPSSGRSSRSGSGARAGAGTAAAPANPGRPATPAPATNRNDLGF